MDTEYAKNHDGGLQPLKDAHGRAKTLADGTHVHRPVLYEELFTHTSYKPSHLVAQPYPVKELDFTSGGAYSVYNWELFYHIPLAVAIHLSQNQRFKEAEVWFRFVIDLTDDSDGPTPERFWKVKPFQTTDVKLIEQTLVNLSTGHDPALHADTIQGIEAWKHDPFQPFLVARYRQSEFMLRAVMAYFDHKIAWGDTLFAEYTGESINEAEQHYITVGLTLARKPQAVPQKGT
jgi:hypothetical protein